MNLMILRGRVFWGDPHLKVWPRESQTKALALLDSNLPKNMIDSLLSLVKLDMQATMFKLAMKSNALASMKMPFDENHLPIIWRPIETSSMLQESCLEYLRVVHNRHTHVTPNKFQGAMHMKLSSYG